MKTWLASLGLSLLLALLPGALSGQADEKAAECGFEVYEQALAKGKESLRQGMTEDLHKDLNHLLGQVAARLTTLPENEIEARCARRLASLYHQMGQIGRTVGQVENAERWLQKAQALYRQQFGESAPVLADVFDDLSELYYSTRRYDEGFALLERSYELRRTGLEPGDPKIAKSLMDLGSAYQLRGEVGLAEDFYRRGIAILEKAGQEHAEQLGGALLVLASLLKESGDTQEAEALTDRGLALTEP